MSIKTRTEQRLELAELLLQVIENPAEIRVIVDTNLPNLEYPGEEEETIYYMIDRSNGIDFEEVAAEDGTTTRIEETEIFDAWHVTNSAGNGSDFPNSADVLNFFDRLSCCTEIDARLETF